MSFTVVVAGRAERAVYVELVDLIGPDAITTDGSTTLLAIADQSQLVSVLGRLNDLSVPVDEVRPGREPSTTEER